MAADWRFGAACRTVDPELFYPVGGGRAYDTAVSEAKAVCARCPVLAECLAWALDVHDWAVAGGTTPDERRAMRRGAAVA